MIDLLTAEHHCLAEASDLKGKNHTKVKKVGHTSEFLFGRFTDELERQIFI